MDANRVTLVRAARKGDVDKIRALYDRCRLNSAPPLNGHTGRVASEHTVLLAERGGEVVGAAAFRHHRNGLTTLDTLVVAPEHRRSGVGTRLMQAVFHAARDHAQHTVMVRCPFDSDANQFCRAMGFSYAAVQNVDYRAWIAWEKRLLT